VLTFNLGSRCANGCCGNQTVGVTLDRELIGVWSLTSFTPAGVVAGDHTAFFSNVSID
jgi:hypothetical protein